MKPFELTEGLNFPDWAGELEHTLLDVTSHPLAFSHCDAHYTQRDVVCCPQAWNPGRKKLKALETKLKCGKMFDC